MDHNSLDTEWSRPPGAERCSLAKTSDGAARGRTGRKLEFGTRPIKHVLVTGAGGFVGQHLVRELKGRFEVTTLRRIESSAPFGSYQKVLAEEWTDPVKSRATAMIHLAALNVDRLTADSSDFWRECERSNVELTLALAQAAIASGLKRFVFLSSIKAAAHDGLDELSEAIRRSTPYSASKWEAERRLANLFGQDDVATECIVLRPAIVWGPGNRSQMLMLEACAARGLPLPIGAFRKPYNMIYIGNLVDAIVRVLASDRPIGSDVVSYAVDDAGNLTIGDFYNLLSSHAGHGRRAVPVPMSLIRGGVSIFKLLSNTFRIHPSLNRNSLTHLVEERYLDCTKFCAAYSWTPPISSDAAAAETMKWVLQRD